jgi:serine/threonine protein kinase
MAFVKGESLAEKIDRRPQPLQGALSLAIQIAEGLQAAHENRIVHRVVKSGNGMVTAGGTVKIMDFGLAQAGYQHRGSKMAGNRSMGNGSPSPAGEAVNPECASRALGKARQLTDGNSIWHIHNGGWWPGGKAVVYTRDFDQGDILVIENYR